MLGLAVGDDIFPDILVTHLIPEVQITPNV